MPRFLYITPELAIDTYAIRKIELYLGGVAIQICDERLTFGEDEADIIMNWLHLVDGAVYGEWPLKGRRGYINLITREIIQEREGKDAQTN